jgi:cyclic pyranopterin phosphate synthase
VAENQQAEIDQRGRPLRDLRISVTDRCNLRCPYCMPAEVYGARYAFLPRPELLTFEEIERLARLFVELGVEKLRITGGEPLLRHQLPALVGRLAALPGLRDLTLTTNGLLLERQAAALGEAGLHRISVSLDSHDESVFRRMSGGRAGPAPVLAGIEAAVRAGLTPVKVNCVVQRGVNDAGILELARLFKGAGVILRFIEYMDVGTLNGWELAQVVPAREILERIDAELPLEPMARAYPGEVATRYRYRDGSGEIGLIASVSQPFCGDCTRARLSTDGKLVTCLFATGGTDLRGPLREGASDEALRAKIRAVWRLRTDRYSEERAAHTDFCGGPARPKIEMYQIGG